VVVDDEFAFKDTGAQTRVGSGEEDKQRGDGG